MNKIAFIFPGQGAQYIGMGKEIIDNIKVSKEIFEIADNALDFDLDEICNTEQELINNTAYTQPALLAISIAILKAVEEIGVKPDFVAGLSLGEYTALVANGALDFQEAVQLVRKRGMYMEEAAQATKGSMAAIMGGTREQIETICNEVNGIVSIANYNSPSQIVIAGETDAVEEAGQRLQNESLRVIPLKVSGAFHSELMDSAAQKLKKDIDTISFSDFSIPYTANINAEIITDKNIIGRLLVEQVKGSVRWEDCVNILIKQGVETFVEIGPGKTLSGLIKKIDRKKKVINIETLEDLNKLKMSMEG